MTSPETLELEAVDSALAGRHVAPEFAELAELALLLRDDRPEPTLTWTTHMDRRVDAGFPARPRRRPWLRLRLGEWWRAAAVVSALLLPVALAAVLMAGDGGGGGFGSDDEGTSPASSASGGGSDVASSGASSGAEESDTAQVAPQSRGSADADSGAGVDSARQQAPPIGDSSTGDAKSDARDRRRVERSASLTLVAPRREIDQVASRVAQTTAELGGFVASSSVGSGGGDLQLRVPSDRLDTVIQRLSKLATVRNLSRQSLDITSAVVSARERLTDARTERVSLLRQLADADTVNETESIRARLAIVSQEIASARTSLRRVNNRANFANVSVALVAGSGGDSSDEGAWTPGDAFGDALRVLEVAAGVAVIAAAVLVPLLFAWLLGWLARRGVTHRRRERALDMA